mmetsp:Transcript_79776/g.230601  ORF Transcript_79776/g.230601 Transcript_79776/m.230601 type:complete len:262 (-) Transcript_79776:895-1680(-)
MRALEVELVGGLPAGLRPRQHVAAGQRVELLRRGGHRPLRRAEFPEALHLRRARLPKVEEEEDRVEVRDLPAQVEAHRYACGAARRAVRREAPQEQLQGLRPGRPVRDPAGVDHLRCREPPAVVPHERLFRLHDGGGLVGQRGSVGLPGEFLCEGEVRRTAGGPGHGAPHHLQGARSQLLRPLRPGIGGPAVHQRQGVLQSRGAEVERVRHVHRLLPGPRRVREVGLQGLLRSGALLERRRHSHAEIGEIDAARAHGPAHS